MADTVPIFTTRRLIPHSGRHLPPLPWLHPFDRPVSDTPPHQPQRRMADGRGHPAHLAVSAFADGQPEPAVGHGLAEADRRVAGPEGGRETANVNAFGLEIGRAACRESVCQYVEISVVGGSLKKKQRKYHR